MTGLTSPIPLFEVVGDSLKGGVTKPIVTIRKIVNDSSNTFYAPIPAEMLYTISKIKNSMHFFLNLFSR